MGTHRFLIIALLTCIALSPARARLGETLEQCVQRYGPATEIKGSGTPPLDKSYEFHKGGFKITVRLLNGKVSWILYTSPNPIPLESIKAILGLAAEGSEWVFDAAATEREKSTVMRKEELYVRKDHGAEAKYQEVGEYNGLLIMTSACRKALSPELNGL